MYDDEIAKIVGKMIVGLLRGFILNEFCQCYSIEMRYKDEY